MTLDLESTRRDLIAMRVKHGADSAIGMTCSNIIEQLQNYEAAEQAEHREWLLKAIREQMARLAALNAEEGKTP